MVDTIYIQYYIKCCWIIFSQSSNDEIDKFNQFNNLYSNYLINLIKSLKLSTTNLIISLNFLYKYQSLNSMNQINLNDDVSILNYLILTSLILSNKSFNDQSYTIKTWFNISNDQLNFKKLSINLLNHFENHFLSVVNYNLNYNKIMYDDQFWNKLFDHCNLLNVDPAVIHYFKNYITCPSKSTLITPLSTPIKSFHNVPGSGPGSVSGSVPGSVPGPGPGPVSNLNPYPSPLKTISIPNTPTSNSLINQMTNNQSMTSIPHSIPHSSIPHPLILSSSSFTPSILIPTPIISINNSPNYSFNNHTSNVNHNNNINNTNNNNYNTNPEFSSPLCHSNKSSLSFKRRKLNQSSSLVPPMNHHQKLIHPDSHGYIPSINGFMEYTNASMNLTNNNSNANSTANANANMSSSIVPPSIMTFNPSLSIPMSMSMPIHQSITMIPNYDLNQ